MEQAYKHSDIFLTHTWKPDLHERNNHDRVRLINQRLNRLGYSSWFDEVKMEGEIRAKMAEGVDYTSCVIVFVTEEYMRKIDSKVYDNCKFEFDRAIKQKTKTNMFCIVMEEKYDDPKNWFGKLKQKLGDSLFVSMSGNLNDGVYLKKQLDLVVDQLKSKGVTPSQMKKKCQDCTRVGKEGDRQALIVDGDFCTYCSCSLQKTTEAKNYCSECHHHENGTYCSSCKSNLLDKEMIITEQSQQLIKMLALESNCDLGCFNTAEVEQTIQRFKHELQELQAKQTETHSRGEDLQLTDEEFTSEMEMLHESLGEITHDADILAKSANECSNVFQPAYEKELEVLQQTMQSLLVKRNKISQRTANVSRTAEALQHFGKRVLDMKDKLVQRNSIPLHNKSCDCNDCVFERNLTSQMIANGPKYLETLVTDNKIFDVKKAIELKSEILDFKDHNGFNLLLSLAIRHGTLDMCRTALDAGIKIDGTKGLNENLINLVKCRDKIDMLCEHYGQELLNIRDRNGQTPLLKAFLRGDLAVARILEKYVESLDEDQIEYVACKGFKSKGFTYIKDIIKNDNIAAMNAIITAYGTEIIHVCDGDYTPFQWCSMFGSLRMLAMLIENGSDFSALDKQAQTALILAIQYNEGNSEDIAKWLVQRHIHLLEAEDANGSSVFHHAAAMDKANIISILLQCSPPPDLLTKKNQDGNSPLSLAKMKKYDAIVKKFEEYLCVFEKNLTSQMIANGPKYLETLVTDNKIFDVKKAIELKREILDFKEDNGFNLLLSLAIRHGTLDMCRMVLDAGIKIDGTKGLNENLITLVKCRDKIDLLCEHYGQELLNIRDRNGQTPLLKAFLRGDLAVARILEKYVESLDEEQIEYVACKEFKSKGFTYIKDIIENDNIAAMNAIITVYGTEIIHICDGDYTPFQWCSMFGSLRMLAMLVENGSDFTARDKQAQTALILAIQYNEGNSEDIAKWLVQRHIHLLEAEDANGSSVFHHAVARDKANIIPILLQCSPPPEMLTNKNQDGNSPLSLAKMKKYDAIVEKFEEYLCVCQSGHKL